MRQIASRLAPGFIAIFILSAAIAGEEKPAALHPRTGQVISSDAIVVGHVGKISRLPAATRGSVAFWIDRGIKGRLNGEQDIIWLPRSELPEVEVHPERWLLFLKRDGAGAWHINGNPEEGALNVGGSEASEVNQIAKLVGPYQTHSAPEIPSEAEIERWVRKAGTGSSSARREAFGKLLETPDAARPVLQKALSDSDREVANVARTLLPLSGGGPQVNGLRLVLEPAAVELGSTAKLLTLHFANLTSRDMKFVSGLSSLGDVVCAANAWEVHKEISKAKDGVSEGALPTVLPKTYAVEGDAASPPLPLVRTVPNLGTLPMAIEVEIESVEGTGGLRLKFPTGHVELPGPGKYTIRAHFACPGPRLDQKRLLEENYWGGGQLVSNEIVIKVTGK